MDSLCCVVLGVICGLNVEMRVVLVDGSSSAMLIELITLCGLSCAFLVAFFHLCINAIAGAALFGAFMPTIKGATLLGA